MALEDVFERCAEVAVKPSVDDWIEKTVGIAEPQEQAVEPLWNTRLLVIAERFNERYNEEWKPADSERTHDDSESFSCLTLV